LWGPGRISSISGRRRFSVVRVIELSVPELKRNPVIGSGLGCCVVLAEDAVRDALLGLPGVKGVQVQAEAGRVRVVFDPEAVSPEEIVGTLKSLGYPPEGESCDVAAEG